MPDQTTTGAAVAESLTRYEEEHGDPTAAVYARFYAAHPDAEELFGGDTLMPRRMMSEIFATIIDIADGTLDAPHATTWIADHIAYEVTRPMLTTMFAIIVDVMREGLGDAWDRTTESEWTDVMSRWSAAALTAFDEQS